MAQRDAEIENRKTFAVHLFTNRKKERKKE